MVASGETFGGMNDQAGTNGPPPFAACRKDAAQGRDGAVPAN